MKDRTILYIISLLLLIWCLGTLASIFGAEGIGDVAFYIGSVGRLLGVLLLIKIGSFVKTRFFRMALLCLAVIIVGSLFKIMHWPGSGYFFLTAFIAIPILYIYHFARKPNKGALDLMKVIWVILFYAAGLLTIFHYPAAPLRLTEEVLFCVVFWMYTFSKPPSENTGFQWLPNEKEQ